MNGDPRDPLDDAIAHDLGSLAPDDIDADAVLGTMRPALHRARARRRFAVTSGVVGSLVIVVGLGGLLAGRDSNQVDVRGNPTTLPSTSTPTTRKTATSTTTTPKSTPTSTSTPSSTPDTTPNSTPTTPSTPTSDDHGGTTQPGPGTSTPPPAAPVTNTYSSVGGKMKVTLANGVLTLNSYTPSAGYQAEVHNQDSDDVEVRFSNGDKESRIRVRVQDGAMVPEITEH